MKYKDDLHQVRDILLDGGIILYPTDTIWGIGCDAINEAAIQKICALKMRPAEKSFILLVDSIEMLHDYAEEVTPRVDALLRVYERPLTIIYEAAQKLPPFAKAADQTVAIRVVRDEFCQDLIQLLGRPITSTSANLNQSPFPAHFGEINSDVIEGVDYVVRHRRNDRQPSQPSIIARYDKIAKELEFLRP